MTFTGYPDRRHAGRALAPLLGGYAGRRDTLVLALPRGGVPVAYEVARALRAPLDVFSVRKLGVPGREELAMGAIGSGGTEVLNRDIVTALRISPAEIARVAARERRELERRERAYRDQRPYARVAGAVAIVVDDGLATGASMLAAVQALRAAGAARIVVGVPVGPADTVAIVRRAADDVVCAALPEPFGGVGAWYDDFEQVDDDEVRALLAREG